MANDGAALAADPECSADRIREVNPQVLREPLQRPARKKKRKSAVSVYVDRFLWKWSLDHPAGEEFRTLLLSPTIEPVMSMDFLFAAAKEAPQLEGWLVQLRANAIFFDAFVQRNPGDDLRLSGRTWYPADSPESRLLQAVSKNPDFIQATESRVFLAALCGCRAFVTLRDYFLRHKTDPLMELLGFTFWPPDEFLAAWREGRFLADGNL